MFPVAKLCNTRLELFQLGFLQMRYMKSLQYLEKDIKGAESEGMKAGQSNLWFNASRTARRRDFRTHELLRTVPSKNIRVVEARFVNNSKKFMF